jgi:ATP-dependent protease ClpP protease subunit
MSIVLSPNLVQVGGSINDKSWKQFVIDFREVAKTRGEIVILICSDGGEPEIGIAMYEFIKVSRKRVATVALGNLKSAVVPAFLAAPVDRRFMGQKTLTLIHDIRWKLKGTRTYMDQALDSLRISASTYTQIITSETKLSVTKVEEMLRNETYFTPEDLEDKGFYGELLGNQVKQTGKIVKMKSSRTTRR